MIFHRSLDRESFTPLYHQLEECLRSKIRDEKLQPGDPLPSEQELAKEFNVSRITVRQAMLRLQFEGVVERRQGKGTFVGRPKLVHSDRLVRPFEQEIVAQGRSPGFQFISYAELEPSPKVREQLRCAVGELVFHLERLKLLDGEPWAIENRFFPHRIGKVLDKGNLESLPIYQLLETVLGRLPKHVIETIGCSVVRQDEAQSLRIHVGFPVLVADHVMFDDSGVPVECGKTILRGDWYQLRLDVWRNP